MKNRIDQANGPAAAGETSDPTTGLIIGPPSSANADGASPSAPLGPPSFLDLRAGKIQDADADSKREQGLPPGIPPNGGAGLQAEPAKPVAKAKDALVTMFESARIPQDVSRQEVGRKLIETVPVRKPGKEVWFRFCPAGRRCRWLLTRAVV